MVLALASCKKEQEPIPIQSGDSHIDCLMISSSWEDSTFANRQELHINGQLIIPWMMGGIPPTELSDGDTAMIRLYANGPDSVSAIVYWQGCDSALHSIDTLYACCGMQNGVDELIYVAP